MKVLLHILKYLIGKSIEMYNFKSFRSILLVLGKQGKSLYDMCMLNNKVIEFDYKIIVVKIYLWLYIIISFFNF